MLLILAPAREVRSIPADRQRTLEVRKTRYVPAYWIALVHAGLEDIDQALAWLERAYDERYFYLVWLNVTPQFEAFHSDPRFLDLLQRIGLTIYAPPQPARAGN